MQVIVDSLLVNYRSIGKEKETIVMLHGWGDSSSTFDRIASTLSNKYTIILIDLPGFGGTQPPSQSWGLDEYAKFVADFLQKINCKNIKAIVGHSNGGAIVLRGLGSGVLSAGKLVLLASAGIRDQYKGRKKVLRLVAKTAKLMTKPLPKQVQARLKKKAYRAIGSDLFVAEHLQETFKRIITDDVQADAEKVRIPCLLIYGSEDTATPPEYGEIYHRLIKNSKLHILPNAGHFVHLDQPDEVTQLIRKNIV